MVLPAPFGPSRPKIGAARDVEAQTVDGAHGRLAAPGVHLDEIADTDGGFRHMKQSGVRLQPDPKFVAPGFSRPASGFSRTTTSVGGERDDPVAIADSHRGLN